MENLGEPELIRSFEDYLIAKGLMERTRKEYLSYLKNFLLGLQGVEPAQEYINKFLNKNNKMARAFVSHYIKFMNRNDLIIPKITGSAFKPIGLVDYISRKEVNKISIEFDKLDNRLRNKLMLAISFQGALREMELLNITPNDCNFKKWFENQNEPLEIRVLGKGNKQRIIYVSPDIAQELVEYIEKVKFNLTFDEKEDKNSFKLFSNKGNGIKARRWRELINQTSEKALGKKIHPHQLRHSFAMYAKDNLCWSLEKISKYLGHSSLQVTTIYAKTTDPELKKAFEEGMNED